MYTMYIHQTLWELRDLPLKEAAQFSAKNTWLHSRTVLLRSTKINSTWKNVQSSGERWIVGPTMTNPLSVSPEFRPVQPLTAHIDPRHFLRLDSDGQSAGWGSWRRSSRANAAHPLRCGVCYCSTLLASSWAECQLLHFIRRHNWDHSMLCMKLVSCFTDRRAT